MRILLVSHDFLPAHPLGTELYTAELGARLRAHGHQVELFTTEKDVSRPHLELTRREWDGMVVHELINNHFYEGFTETWDWPPAVEAFLRVVDAFNPDLVHVNHLLYLSIGIVERAHARGIPVVYTLHDFWLTCARFGQLVHADGTICHTVDFERCGTCLARMKFAQSPLERSMARVISGARALTGFDLGPAARRAAGALGLGRGRQAPSEPPAEAASRMRAAMEARDAAFKARLVPSVDRFLAPSRFLRQRMIEWGIPDGAIAHVPNGVDRARFTGLDRTDSPHLRVGFIGSLAPHKAPHLLLEAWKRLAPDLRARGELTIHGPGDHHPDYAARLSGLAEEAGARIAGPLAREEVPATLAALDLLVVPSVWYENAPLIILEARAAGTALVVSDLGGMAELVGEGRHGWRFAPGDADALAALLGRVLEDPGLVAALTPDEPPVLDMDEVARRVEGHYREALMAASPGSGA